MWRGGRMKVRPRAYKQMFFIRSFPHRNFRDLFQFVPSLCNFYNRALFTYFGEIIISNSTQYFQNVFFCLLLFWLRIVSIVFPIYTHNLFFFPFVLQIERTIGKNLQGMRGLTADELLALLTTNKLNVSPRSFVFSLYLTTGPVIKYH